MNDDLDDLKSMMTTPLPDAKRKAANLAAAQEIFDRTQGSMADARPTSVTGPMALWTGVKGMLNTLTSKGGLTATTALVACGFLFLTPTGQDLWQTGAPTLFQEAGREARIAEEVANAPGNFTTPVPAPRAENQAKADVAISDAEMDWDMVVSSDELGDVSAVQGLTASAPAVKTSRAHDSVALADTIAIEQQNSENYANATPNPLKITTAEPVSTFSIDVDTASYSIVRSSLMRGQLPPKGAVRVEELMNYFPYDYAAPDANGAPFQPTVSVMDTPWNADTQLVHIALQGALPDIDMRPPLNLVFLIDTSGSMSDADKLPLLKQSFMLMLDQLRPEDQVAIVEYAGSAGEVLAPTNASDRTKILQAIQGLGAGGSTNGQGGLEQAYAVADRMAEDGELSRVILATDGDFNVGIHDPNALKSFISEKRDTGTFLSVLGFGRGNLDDATMQSLVQNGNGQAAYIDTLSEAQKVLVDQLSGALFTIASDVKVQVEFNPATVAEYRLIGYETRALNREDFNNDRVDAGEIGAGHSVTALYEITPIGSPAQLSDPLRYGGAERSATSDELGFLKLRYKQPGATTSQLIETPIINEPVTWSEANFAVAIAGFGQLLRGGDYLGDWSYADAIALANANRGADNFGYRTEAVQMMRLAQSLSQ